MKLTLFGATGRTGIVLLSQALERGHQVRAYTRSPAKLGDHQHELLEVIEGDLHDAEGVTRAIVGSDAVISVLGPTRNKPDYHVSRGTRIIIGAMHENAVPRLLVTAGAGVGFEKDRPGPLDRVIKALLLLLSRHVYEDMRRTVELVTGFGSRVDRGASTDADQRPWYRTGAGRLRRSVDTGVRIARPDIATFLLNELEAGEHVRDAPMISN